MDNQFYKKVTALRRHGIKVTIAIGGWNDSKGSKYSRMANSREARARFTNHVVGFIEKHGFDGLDLDYEFPDASDKVNFAEWVKDIKTVFQTEGYEVNKF